MALPPIVPADFIADIKLSQNRFRTTELTAYISFFYAQILSDLIGEDGTQEIEDTAPLPAKYDDLLTTVGTYYNVELEETRKLPQLVEVVKRFLYFQWVRDYSINTTSGDSKNEAENATMLNRDEIASNARQRYNWAAKRFNDRTLAFLDNYEDYESTISSVNVIGGGVVELLTPDTIYLLDGDSVTIGGTDYVISSLVADTSFRITASFATDPTTYTYSPFEDLIYSHQEPALF